MGMEILNLAVILHVFEKGNGVVVRLRVIHVGVGEDLEVDVESSPRRLKKDTVGDALPRVPYDRGLAPITKYGGLLRLARQRAA